MDQAAEHPRKLDDRMTAGDVEFVKYNNHIMKEYTFRDQMWGKLKKRVMPKVHP